MASRHLARLGQWGHSSTLLVLTIAALLWVARPVGAASPQPSGTRSTLLGQLPQPAARSHAAKPQSAKVTPMTAALRPVATRLAAQTTAVCNGQWQGAPTYRSSGWILGQEVYACYQDPTLTGCPSPYPFSVKNVYWAMMVDQNTTVALQPVIASNVGTPSCPLPGTVLCLGEADTLTLGPGAWMIQMPISTSCSVAGSYFACVYIPDAVAPGLDLIFDADTLHPKACRSYDDWGDGWQDLAAAFPDMILYSDGESSAPACACNCHGDPSCDGVSDVLDVVKAISVAFRGAVAATDPNSLCPRYPCDVDCNGVIDVLDVVRVISVSFRGGDPATFICNACP